MKVPKIHVVGDGWGGNDLLNLADKLRRKIIKSTGYLPDSIEIAFKVHIDLLRLDSLWYGGTIVSIRFNGWQFNLVTEGDVLAKLYAKYDSGSPVVDVYDRGNAGEFVSMKPHVLSDDMLRALSTGRDGKALLAIHNNNWWEVDVITSENQAMRLENWIAKDTDMLAAICEVISDYETIKEMTLRQLQ